MLETSLFCQHPSSHAPRCNRRHSTESLTEQLHFDRHLRHSDNTSMVDSHHRIRNMSTQIDIHIPVLPAPCVRIA